MSDTPLDDLFRTMRAAAGVPQVVYRNRRGEPVPFDVAAAEDKVVAQEVVAGRLVSTIFLPTPHACDCGHQDAHFETMVFNPAETRGRYHSMIDAIRGHAEVVKDVRRCSS